MLADSLFCLSAFLIYNVMKHMPLDIYDDMPTAMRRYISQYGFHFNKKACDYAVSKMKYKNPSTGKLEQLTPWTKDQVEEFLKNYGIKLDNDIMYDKVYIIHMCRADYYMSSVVDDRCLALYVKDTIDDVDGSDELPFRYWLQKCIALGEPVDFEDLL